MVPLPGLGMGGRTTRSLEAWPHLHQAQTWVARPGELVDDGGSYTWAPCWHHLSCPGRWHPSPPPR